MVNQEEALDVIQGQGQQLVEYADTVLHLNGVLDLMIDSLGGAEAALVQAVDSILVLYGALESSVDSVAVLNGVWATATDSVTALNGVWATATDSIAALNNALVIATDSLVVLFSIPGCTYSNYLEYNAEATWEDGSCVTFIVEGCTDYLYAEFDEAANVDDGSCSSYLCTTVAMDGYTYDLVQIGDQCWFAENLRTTFTSQGTEIPYMTKSGGVIGRVRRGPKLRTQQRKTTSMASTSSTANCGWRHDFLRPHAAVGRRLERTRRFRLFDINRLRHLWVQGAPWGSFSSNNWYGVGSYVGSFWTSTKTSSTRAKSYSLNESSNGIAITSAYYGNGFSVRCVHDRT